MDESLSQLLEEFLLEARERAARVEHALLDLEDSLPDRRALLLERARRELHTLKGNAGMLGLGGPQRLAHRLEDMVEGLAPVAPEVAPVLDELDRLRLELAELASGAGGAAPGEPDSWLRVAPARLDELMAAVAEGLTHRHRLALAVGHGRQLDPGDPGFAERSADAWEAAGEALHALEVDLRRLEEEVQGLRMVPLRTLFAPLRRIVSDGARQTGKRARLLTGGGEATLDRSLVGLAGDALGHLVRNAVLHGIETPAERQRRGKSAAGTVAVQAAVEGDLVRLTVEDDGAGLDRDGLRDAARRLGVEETRLDDLHTLVFLPGLTTRRAADLGAGRGIGLAAVLEAARAAGGGVEVASEPGRGTRFTLSLPLQVTLTRVLRVAADGREYALPVRAVVDTARRPGGDGGGSTVEWRGHRLPVLDLGQALGTSVTPRRDGYLAVVGAEGRVRGLLVDQLVGLQQVVVSDLDEVAGRPAGIGGTTVLGDGRVLLILDPTTLTTLEVATR